MHEEYNMAIDVDFIQYMLIYHIAIFFFGGGAKFSSMSKILLVHGKNFVVESSSLNHTPYTQR